MTGPLGWPGVDLLARRADTTPDDTAFVEDGSGETWTYRDLDVRVSRLAGWLADRGVGRGDRIGLLLGNRVEVVELVHAASRRAATLAPLNVRLADTELRAQVRAADLDLLICEESTEESARAAADCSVVLVGDLPDSDGGLLAVEGSAEPLPIDRDDELLVLFTSGTTGDPKGVRLTAGNLMASATASAFRLGVDPDDRWLVTLPTYHMGGLAPIYRSALYGTTVVLQREFDAGETARTIENRGVTGVSLVPTMLARLLDAGWSPPAHLRFVLLGGAPASRELIERCERRGVPVHPTYGMTETASQVATARPSEAFEYDGTVGRPLAFTQVRIESEDGDPCEPGRPGEIVVSGPTVSPGYLDDDQTCASFEDGRFHTGDVGYRDEGGRLWIVDRLDDLIVTGGENVHPGEVVEALVSHEGVADAAVVGVPDEEWGERVTALVVPESEESIDSEELRTHLDGRLARYKHPRTVEFVEELPRTPSGTVDREAVREYLRDVES